MGIVLYVWDTALLLRVDHMCTNACVYTYVCMSVCLSVIYIYNAVKSKTKWEEMKYGVSASILVPLSKHSSGFDYIS